MIENPKNVIMPQPKIASADDKSVESVAIAGASAIQRLIAQRDSYYTRLSEQERKFELVKADNEDLRRRLALVRESYVGAARSILAQLEQLDRTTQEVMGRGSRRSDTANVVPYRPPL